MVDHTVTLRLNHQRPSAFQAKSAKVHDALDQMQRNLRLPWEGMYLEANDAGYPLVN